jgi:hypothetical protein
MSCIRIIIVQARMCGSRLLISMYVYSNTGGTFVYLILHNIGVTISMLHLRYPPHHAALAASRSITSQTRPELVQCVECEVWRVRREEPYSQIEIAVSSIGRAMEKQVVFLINSAGKW